MRIIKTQRKQVLLYEILVFVICLSCYYEKMIIKKIMEN